jgi:hypothetical protein
VRPDRDRRASWAGGGDLRCAIPNLSSFHTTIRIDTRAVAGWSEPLFTTLPVDEYETYLTEFSVRAQEISWDGTDEVGRPTPAGIYLIRAWTEAGSRSGRFVIVR